MGVLKPHFPCWSAEECSHWHRGIAARRPALFPPAFTRIASSASARSRINRSTSPLTAVSFALCSWRTPPSLRVGPEQFDFRLDARTGNR